MNKKSVLRRRIEVTLTMTVIPLVLYPFILSFTKLESNVIVLTWLFSTFSSGLLLVALTKYVEIKINSFLLAILGLWMIIPSFVGVFIAALIYGTYKLPEWVL